MRADHKPSYDEFEEVNEPEEAPEAPEEDLGDLIDEMKLTLDKLVQDQASRADVKLLRTALKELRYAFKALSPYAQNRKVTVFGSARLSAEDPAYQQAVEFGKRIAEAGYMVITGAAAGIMEAGHVGAGRENSVGLNILLPFESQSNHIIRDDPKLMHFKYFFTRKLLFVKEADAVVHFPGGFGTQDECFEALTLVQTGKSHLFPVVMVDQPGGDYWARWTRYVEEVLLSRKLVSPEDRAFYKVTDSVDEAVAEVVNFYRVYHSMRYVGKDLVFRLNEPISEERLESIRTDFADIVVEGTYELTEALPEETNEPHLSDLPRLRFRFNRHHLGRLRTLVDRINAPA